MNTATAHSTSNAELDALTAGRDPGHDVRREPKTPIRYIGGKARKTDNLYGTGVTWYGPGDVQEVPISKARKFLAHANVWALPGEPWTRPKAPVAPRVLADLVLAGDWAAIAEMAPEVAASARAFFAERSDHVSPAPHGIAAAADRPSDVGAWAAGIVEGTVRDVEARLAVHADVLAAEPALFEALGQAEVAGKNRRSVLDLIQDAEATATSGQQAIFAADQASAGQ